ncbi:MAG: hypothetical protein BWX70_03116 [Verrucomicrobia bacterium ADurb.Bin070]|nr:MAG: hypothetical protein BWX70_03116 [Verrucomicrobia bacterium ADurb.Bin070]
MPYRLAVAPSMTPPAPSITAVAGWVKVPALGSTVAAVPMASVPSSVRAPPPSYTLPLAWPTVRVSYWCRPLSVSAAVPNLATSRAASVCAPVSSV